MVSHSEIKETDLIKDHRELLRTFMKQNTKWKLSSRKKVLELYDETISKENIRYYINRNMKVFFYYLVTGKVKKSAKYFPKGFMNEEEE